MSDKDTAERESTNPGAREEEAVKDPGGERGTEAEPNGGGIGPDAEIHKLKDQLLRKAAEFENFKRRTRDEKDQLIKFGNQTLLLDILPVIDDFERSLASGKEHPDFDSFYNGVDIVFTKFVKALENRGMRPIEAKGKAFDVDFHDALVQIPTDDVEAGTILEEVEKGYMLYDRVIRHSKVTVSKSPGNEE